MEIDEPQIGKRARCLLYADDLKILDPNLTAWPFNVTLMPSLKRQVQTIKTYLLHTRIVIQHELHWI